MDLGTCKSVDAETWVADRFWCDPKSLCGDLWNFDFSQFLGGQSSNFRYFDKILDFEPLKNREESKFQKSLDNVFVSPWKNMKNFGSI